MDNKEIKQMIKEQYPTSYENNTYGSLSMLYDDIKDIELSKLTDDKLRLLYFQIYDITNDAINYAKTNVLKTDKLDTLIMKVEAINKIKDKIIIVSNDDLLELKIAFDFELDYKKEIKLIERAADIETRIRAAIATNKVVVIPNEKPKKRFKDLFKTEELYEKAINKLIEHQFIKRRKDNLEWVYQNTVINFTPPQLLTALYVVLDNSNYLKKESKPAAYYPIYYDFGIKIDKSNFSSMAKGFRTDYNTPNAKNNSYTSLFTKIIEVV